MRLRRILLVVAAMAASGCGGVETSAERSRPLPAEVADPGRRACAAGSPRETRRDAELGISYSYPCDWHRPPAPLTRSIDPREVLALATYPLGGRGEGGGPCVAAGAAVAAMPRSGALIWLLEYRPPRGDVWADLPRERFPHRPERFELSRDDLQPGLCGAGLGTSVAFRDADRPFQLWLLMGDEVSDARLGEIREILDGLRFDELPAPPPDPYAGWPLINDNPGDSLRPPPGWAAAAAMFPPGATRRPRPLFFASNRPLLGLPQKLVPHVDELPGPWPAHAVANDFPDDGVLLWVLEEESGEASQEFPPIDRTWPGAADFRPADVLTKPNPELRWLRAGGSFRGYRFSVWIAAGAASTAADRALAVKSAGSLAVSGCWRDGYDDCPDS